jgi:hypothetical protein
LAPAKGISNELRAWDILNEPRKIQLILNKEGNAFFSMQN